MYMELPLLAALPVNSVASPSVTLPLPPTCKAPPSSPAKLPVKRHASKLASPPTMCTAPPFRAARLLVNVLSRTASMPADMVRAPPSVAAEALSKVQSDTSARLPLMAICPRRMSPRNETTGAPSPTVNSSPGPLAGACNKAREPPTMRISLLLMLASNEMASSSNGSSPSI